MLLGGLAILFDCFGAYCLIMVLGTVACELLWVFGRCDFVLAVCVIWYCGLGLGVCSCGDCALSFVCL